MTDKLPPEHLEALAEYRRTLDALHALVRTAGPRLTDDEIAATVQEARGVTARLWVGTTADGHIALRIGHSTFSLPRDDAKWLHDALGERLDQLAAHDEVPDGR